MAVNIVDSSGGPLPIEARNSEGQVNWSMSDAPAGMLLSSSSGPDTSLIWEGVPDGGYIIRMMAEDSRNSACYGRYVYEYFYLTVGDGCMPAPDNVVGTPGKGQYGRNNRWIFSIRNANPDPKINCGFYISQVYQGHPGNLIGYSYSIHNASLALYIGGRQTPSGTVFGVTISGRFSSSPMKFELIAPSWEGVP